MIFITGMEFNTGQLLRP